MGLPISIRLDDDVRSELEAEAKARGIGLATLIRDLATKAAREGKKARIREASKAVAQAVAASADGRALYEDIGTPTTDVQ